MINGWMAKTTFLKLFKNAKLFKKYSSLKIKSNHVFISNEYRNSKPRYCTDFDQGKYSKNMPLFDFQELQLRNTIEFPFIILTTFLNDNRNRNVWALLCVHFLKNQVVFEILNFIDKKWFLIAGTCRSKQI